MKIQIPDEVFGVKKWRCKVRSNDNVATFIKCPVLELPEGEDVDFRAGGYIQIECPPYQLGFKEFRHRRGVSRGLGQVQAVGPARPQHRARDARLLHGELPGGEGHHHAQRADRHAAAARRSGEGAARHHVVLHLQLKPGDEVTISGPFGEFFARETDKEMVFIGGGAGMAPMRSHIFDQLMRIKTKRKITFWYGARSRREMFFVEDFDKLQEENENFKWYVALSDPQPDDNWEGYTGFIHNVLYENYLKDHPAPEECEYYMCGPPIMNTSVINMLLDLGVEREDIMLDDFGG